MSDKDTLTFTSDGFDVVIWKGEEFVTNVGANRMVPANVETVAFDCEVKNAKEICYRWNEHEKLKHRMGKLEEAIKEAARTFATIKMDGTADGLASVLGGFDAINLRQELKFLHVKEDTL